MLDMHPPGGFARLTLYVYDMIAASRNTHSPATTLSQFTPITEHYHTCGELELSSLRLYCRLECICYRTHMHPHTHTQVRKRSSTQIHDLEEKKRNECDAREADVKNGDL